MRAATGWILAALTMSGPVATAFADVAEDEQRLKSAQVGVSGPELLRFLQERTPTPERRQQLDDWIRQLGDNSFLAREQASARLMQAGPIARIALRQALDDADAEVARRAQVCLEVILRQAETEHALLGAVVRLLQDRRPADTVPTLLAYLPFADDEGLTEEILKTLLVVGVQQGQVDDAIVAALRDEAVSRRAAAALVLGSSGNAEQRAAARKTLTDPEALVRFRAAQGLLSARDPEAVPALVALLRDGPLSLAREAEFQLVYLAGGKGPEAELGDTAETRRSCATAWAAWWKDPATPIDWTRVDVHQTLANSGMRTREVAQAFLTALSKSDLPGLQKTTDCPFHLGGWQTFTSRAELDKLLAEVAGMPRQRSFRTAIKKIVPAEEYLRTAEQKVKDQLTKIARNEWQAVYVEIQESANQTVEKGVLAVRLVGGRARVIGYLPAK